MYPQYKNNMIIKIIDKLLIDINIKSIIMGVINSMY
jgi:hypothetical protein